MRWVVFLASCLYAPSVGDGVLACAGKSPQCPEGYFCAANQHCYKNGHTVDAGVNDDDGGSGDDLSAPDPCANGTLDDGEADIDCGGVCATGCAVTKHCLAGSDCTSTICNLKTNKCVASDCEDGTKNDAETDIDCGGGTCGGCATGQACQAGTDCANHLCHLAKMMCVASTCEDGAQDGTETDADCGGSCAAKCKVGQGCTTVGDCVSPSTCDGSKHCTAVQCTNSAQDTDNAGAVPPISAETDVDCGGLVCAPCQLDQKCLTGTDCASGFCNASTKKCVVDACHDGEKDGAETDVDCGGTCGAKCPDGKMCKGAGDCASGGAICTTGMVCCVPSGTACAGFDCGSKMDNCGQSIVCGANGGGCQSASFSCSSNKCCQTQAATCSGKCGMVTNNCSQTFDCLGCLQGYACDSGLHQCCGNATTACGAQPCGSTTNNCAQTVQCGNAGACVDSTNYTCTSNQCCKKMAYACAGMPCKTVGDGCGNNFSCNQTFGCTSGQVCNGTSCCTPQSDGSACGANSCKNVNVTNNCGQSVNCRFESGGCPGCTPPAMRDCTPNCSCSL